MSKLGTGQSSRAKYLECRVKSNKGSPTSVPRTKLESMVEDRWCEQPIPHRWCTFLKQNVTICDC